MNRSLRILARLVAIAAGVIAVQHFCVRPWIANRILQRVEIRTRAAVAAADPQRATILARISLNELAGISFIGQYDVSYHLLFAANARLLNRTAEALTHYEAALRVDHRPEIYLQRGLTLLELGRTAEAIPNFITASRFDPAIVDDLDPPIRDQVVRELQR